MHAQATEIHSRKYLPVSTLQENTSSKIFVPYFTVSKRISRFLHEKCNVEKYIVPSVDTLANQHLPLAGCPKFHKNEWES